MKEVDDQGSFMSFDHECFARAESYKHLLRLHANYIISYFMEFTDDCCEVLYSDIFTHCEKTLVDFEVRAFEEAYAYLARKKAINLIVTINKFDGSVSIRGKMDPMYMMRRVASFED